VCGALTGCRNDNDCTSPQQCKNSVCTTPVVADSGVDAGPANGIQVAALFPGSGAGNDGWTTANEDGLTAAIAGVNTARAGAGLPQIVSGGKPFFQQENVRKSADYDKYITQSITAGATVVITASPVGAQEAIKNAPQYAGDGGPNEVKFIATRANNN